METQAHCAYCFETLSSSLEKRPSLSLPQVEALWTKYTAEPTTTDALDPVEPSNKPAAISQLLAPSPPTTNSSSTSSTPSGTSQNSSVSSLSTPESHPLFVTWNTVSKSGSKNLRGCIGTFEAQPLDKGLKTFALTSAFDDTRFNPIAARELPTLSAAVTLLTDFEPAPTPLDWDVGTHGLRISFSAHGRRYGATYLPDVAKEQGWSKEEALESLVRKAGYRGKEGWEALEVKVTRYQGRKVELGYGEWKMWRGWVDEEMDDEEEGEEE